MTRARRRHGTHERDGESGMATAEFAVALPAVALVLAFVVGLAQLLLLHHRAWHAASVGARVAARAESDDAVRAAVRLSGVSGATSITRSSQWVRVAVSVPAPRGFGWALGDITAGAVAAAERGDEGDAANSSGGSP